jgi:hypothetical protein
MSGTELKRRLNAILVADAVGYSRLMSIDARATVARRSIVCARREGRWPIVHLHASVASEPK